MWSRKKDKKRIKELRQIQEEADLKLRGQRPEVHGIATWLTRRRDQNGFGMDFEYTLRPRGS